jgi:hypothetical protein
VPAGAEIPLYTHILTSGPTAWLDADGNLLDFEGVPLIVPKATAGSDPLELFADIPCPLAAYGTMGDRSLLIQPLRVASVRQAELHRAENEADQA